MLLAWDLRFYGVIIILFLAITPPPPTPNEKSLVISTALRCFFSAFVFSVAFPEFHPLSLHLTTVWWRNTRIAISLFRDGELVRKFKRLSLNPNQTLNEKNQFFNGIFKTKESYTRFNGNKQRHTPTLCMQTIWIGFKFHCLVCVCVCDYWPLLVTIAIRVF